MRQICRVDFGSYRGVSSTFTLSRSPGSNEPNAVPTLNSSSSSLSEPIITHSQDCLAEASKKLSQPPRIPCYIEDIPDRVRSALSQSERAYLTNTSESSSEAIVNSQRTLA